MLSLDKKLELWEETLPQDKLMLIAYAVQKDVNEIVDKKMWSINQALTTSFAAALHDLQGLSIAEVEEVIKKGNEYLLEAEIFLSRYKEKWIMEIKKIEPKIKERIKEFMNKGVIKSEALVTLKKEFKIPVKDLSNFWIEVKEELYPEKCINDGNNKVKGEILRKKADTEKEKPSNVITPKGAEKLVEKAKEAKKDMFKVISKETILEGELGAYTVTKNGVQAGNEYFKDLDSVEEYIEKELESFYKRIDEIKAAFAYM